MIPFTAFRLQGGAKVKTKSTTTNSSHHGINLELNSILCKDSSIVQEQNENTSLLKKNSTIVYEKRKNLVFLTASRMKASLVCGLCFIFIFQSFISLNENHEKYDNHGSIQTTKHIYSTFLHFQNEKTDAFLNSSQHPNYESFASGQFNKNVNTKPQIEMWLNKQRISFHESLTLSFEYKDTKEHFETLLDSDIVSLDCPQNEIDPSKFYDIATIKQIHKMNSKTFQLGYNQSKEYDAKISNRINSESFQFLWRYSNPFNNEIDFSHLTPNDLYVNNSNINILQWYIPSFPIIRQETCIFRLWRNTTFTNESQRYDKQYNNQVLTKNYKYYQQNQIYSYNLITQTDPIIIHNADVKPTAIHIAYTHIPTEMTIRFTTGSSEGVPVVTFIETSKLSIDKSNTLEKEDRQNRTKSSSSTTSSPILWSKISGTTISTQGSKPCEIHANDMNHPIKFQSQTFLHSVNLNHLKHDTLYTYKVGVTQKQGGIIWSKPYTFISAPAPSTYPITIVAYSHPDLSVTNLRNTQIQEWISIKNDSNDMKRFNATNTIRAIHYFGDTSHVIGAANVWEEWGAMIEPVAARIPMIIGINNDFYAFSLKCKQSDSNIKCENKRNEPQWDDFLTHDESECKQQPPNQCRISQRHDRVLWYSHNLGIVHTIMISSVHNLKKGSAQYKWLEEDLKKVNRALTPFVILESHILCYDIFDNEITNNFEQRMQPEIENLLRLYKVDLVLASHHYAYQRSCPGLFHHKCNRGGPLYIMVRTEFYSQDSVTSNPKIWTESFYPDALGYGKITAMNHSALLWELIDEKNNSNVLDYVWIKN